MMGNIKIEELRDGEQFTVGYTGRHDEIIDSINEDLTRHYGKIFMLSASYSSDEYGDIALCLFQKVNE